MKNGFVTPSNNFNNIFQPELSKDRNYSGYAVVNNNYYYGRNNTINKIDVKNTPPNLNSNLKSSNIFSYEDPGFKNVNVKINNDNNNNSFQFPNQNVNLEKLNHSCDIQTSLMLNNSCIKNINSNSVLVRSFDNTIALESTNDNYSNKKINLENNVLNLTQLNNSHSRGNLIIYF